MPAISRHEAVRRLLREVASLPADDLAEVYNELFPSQPTTEDQARQNRTGLLDRITDHVNRGLHPEEIVSLWNVVFPKDRHVSYDEETSTLHYGEASESVQYAD
ncbi:MAG TPA: hypothetical protein VKA46_16315 [Gemmataceae bacterium]|nr:hypothetical protein [Gemmataceae bacterium]